MNHSNHQKEEEDYQQDESFDSGRDDSADYDKIEIKQVSED